MHKAARNSSAANKKAHAGGMWCTGLRTARQHRPNCSTTPRKTAKLQQKNKFSQSIRNLTPKTLSMLPIHNKKLFMIPVKYYRFVCTNKVSLITSKFLFYLRIISFIKLCRCHFVQVKAFSTYFEIGGNQSGRDLVNLMDGAKQPNNCFLK